MFLVPPSKLERALVSNLKDIIGVIQKVTFITGES